MGMVYRPYVTNEMVACIAIPSYVNPSTDSLVITNNVCQGSVGYGFVFPHIKCTELSTNSMAYNTAGACRVGFIFNKI